MMDVGTAKDYNATISPTSAAAAPSNVATGGSGLEPDSVPNPSISTGGVNDDGGCVEMDSDSDSVQSTSPSPGTGDVDEGVVEPILVQKKRIRVPSVSRKGQRAICACLLSIAVGVVVGVFIGFRMTHGGYYTPLDGLLGDICGTTLYPDTCNSTLYGADTTTPKSYVSKSMTVSMTSTNSTLRTFTQCVLEWPPFTGMQLSTLQMCAEMYQDMLSAETSFLATLNSINTVQPDVAVVNDLEQRASAALAYHFTCVNGLEEQGLWRDGGDGVCGVDLERSTELLSNALSLVGKFKAANDTGTAPSRRRLLNFSPQGKTTSVPKRSRRMLSRRMDEDRSPPWLNTIDRRILQSTNNNITTNAVVALDGSGDFTSIQAAVDNAPSHSSQRYVIYIKAGTYDERVRVPEEKIRLTLVGDGAGATIVTGNVSSGVQNVSAVFTATVTVSGDFFMAKNMTIRNTAGPNGREAVALRVTSQQSAFTWLSIEGYQNTLYAHTSQQFYSYCTIFGTVDYIFGSAAAIFQECSLLARPPNPGQAITYTASDISSSVMQKYAGLVFHACLVNATSEVTAAQLGFLGRPWQSYARTVFIKSNFGALVNPAGWKTNNDNNVTNTVSSVIHVEFAEYGNYGLGSGTGDRVPWSKRLNAVSVLSYGVDQFLKGNLWLPAMNVSYSRSI